MKKLLIFAMLLLMGHGAFAQSGGLTINNNTTCDLYIMMFGYDQSVPGDGICKLYSPTFVVAAGTTATWPSVWAFQSAIGWFMGTPIPSSSTTFMWTDCAFQWNCEGLSGCAWGGRLSDCITACTAVPNPWVGPCWNGTWSPICGIPMSNVTITF